MKKIILLILTLIFSLTSYPVYAKEESLYNKIASQATADNIKSEFVTYDNGINFKYTSSDTNGKGVYTIASTLKDTYPIHYYRGNIDNNWLKYANLCWQIVRTTDNGGVKLIYGGKPNSDGTCTGVLEYDEELKYDKDYTSNGVSNTYADSDEKQMIESWYENKLVDYTESIYDEIYCNDNESSTSNEKYTNAYFRYIEGKPTLTCPNKEISFTVSKELGNGLLKYPVGELTIDEAIYAGIQDNLENHKLNDDYSNREEVENYGNQVKSYLSFRGTYPTMSGYGEEAIENNVVSGDFLYGNLSFYINNYHISMPIGDCAEGWSYFHSLYEYVRPVIVINGNLAVMGEGTSINPYTLGAIVKPEPEITIPETSDNIISYYIIFGTMITMLMGLVILKKKYE